MSRRVTALFTVALLCLGCEPDQAPPVLPTPADRIPEVSLGAEAIAAEFAVEPAGLVSPVLDAPDGATGGGALIPLDDADAPTPTLHARGVDADGVEGAWSALEVTWREGDQLVAIVDLPELARGAQLRLGPGAAIAQLTWSALVPAPPTEAPSPADDIGAHRASLSADLAALGVNSRESWGARGTRCSSRNPDKYRVAIHHTVSQPGGDPASRLRGIQSYHMDSRGWCDVGYHFLVSVDGRIWEGRPIDLLGAHVGGHNTGNIGISFIGCFHSSGCGAIEGPREPPNVMIENVAGFVAGLSSLYGFAITPSSVKGHRDHSGQSTSCPGDHLHSRLDDIRSGEVGPVYGAAYVEQSFPLARDPFELAPNEVVAGYLEMRNTGTEPWRPGETFLGTTEPRDVESPIAAPSWIAPNRAATIDRVVNPGETGRFELEVQAPATPGEYPQYFNLVQEGVAWFGDPGQGGPPDGQLQIRVTTLDVPPVMPDAGAPPPPPPPADASMGDPDAGAPMAETDAGGGEMREMAEGCSCRAGSGAPASPAWLALAALALLRPRRRR